MNKKNKTGKNSSQTQPGGYKNFISDVATIMKRFNFKVKLSEMPLQYKKMMWDYKIVIRHPIAGNDNISSKEIKFIASETKKYFYKATKVAGGKIISSYELLLLDCYCHVRTVEMKRKSSSKYDLELLEMKDIKKQAFQNFFAKYTIDYFRVVIGINSPDKKHYGISLRQAKVFKEFPYIELVTSLYGFEPIKRMISINGLKRPAWRLAKNDAINQVTWISIDSTLLKDFYKGDKKELEVYIQSHALNRMRERLDLLSTEANNYLLWENTREIAGFITYKNYLYLPVKLYDVKVGYLLANIVDNQLLFRTFLFITHNITPEGDKLKQISGLGKQDITYWHIDRLSTFVKFNDEKYPGLSALFDKAGLGSLSQLKEKEFDVETLQEANLDGLAEYLGKKDTLNLF